MYFHICKNELCKSCYKMSCQCEWTIINKDIGKLGDGMVTEFYCPHCGAVMLSYTITSNSTNIVLKQNENSKNS